jgi:hypothetical protein
VLIITVVCMAIILPINFTMGSVQVSTATGYIEDDWLIAAEIWCKKSSFNGCFCKVFIRDALDIRPDTGFDLPAMCPYTGYRK